MDYSDLYGGVEFEEELVSAASYSRVVVVVLSKTYQWRYWCMRELHLAMRARYHEPRGTVVIPVFYDEEEEVLQPDEVRERWGKGGDLFEKYPERQKDIDGKAWAKNLEEITSIQRHSRRVQGQKPAKDEDRQLAIEVVKSCVRYLGPQEPTGYVVGYKEQMFHIASKLGGPGRLGVWLHGCGEFEFVRCYRPICTHGRKELRTATRA
jgi:hypothetical protein